MPLPVTTSALPWLRRNFFNDSTQTVGKRSLGLLFLFIKLRKRFPVFCQLFQKSRRLP
jgi:hypothetical protein